MLARILVPFLILLLTGCGAPSPGERPRRLGEPVQGGAGSLPPEGLRNLEVASRTISGRIHGLAPGEHVLVVARGERIVRATTRLDGIWELHRLAPGVYDVLPIHERYAFEPPSMRISLLESDAEVVEFTASSRSTTGHAGHREPAAASAVAESNREDQREAP